MEPTQFQTANKPLETPLQAANVVRKAHLVSASSNSSTNTVSTSNANPASVASTAQSNTSGIAGGGGTAATSFEPPRSTGSVTSNNLIQQATNSIVASVANGQPQTNATNAVTSNPAHQPTAQQIIQVSSQGSAIMPGQLMVQALSTGRPTIQLRAAQAGQQFQQIQLIPFSNLQGPNQRPVIIQQSPTGNVIHSASATTITSMANLTHNVAKITQVGTAQVGTANSLPNSTVARQPVHIIQQSQAGQFIHSTNAQPHNVTKLVGRAPARTPVTGAAPSTVGGKMVLGNHTGPAVQQNHLANNTANPQQVTRLNFISSLPAGVHTSVSGVQPHGTAAKPILGLTTTLNKPLIINPTNNVVQPASIVGNVVNMNNPTAHHQLKQPNTGSGIIPTVMTLTTLTTSSGSIPGRHTMITTSTSHPTQAYPQAAPTTASQQRLTVQPSSNSTAAGAAVISSASLAASNLQSQPISTSHASSTLQPNTTAVNHQPQQSTAIRSNLLTTSSASNTLNSPIKPAPQGTPSSPRPSILIRKRVGTPLDLDSKASYQSASTNSNSANSSQLNSVKQNLTAKYNSLPASTNQQQTAGAALGAAGKSAPELLCKPALNNLSNLKKPHLDAGQLPKNENDFGKPEAGDCDSPNSHPAQSNSAANSSLANSSSTDNRQITPRKRRKQLLEPFMLTTSQSMKLLNDDATANSLVCSEELLRKKENAPLPSGSSSICRRPRPSLLSSYNLTWKSLQYHFLRHTEVKIKSEKKINLSELTNETLKKGKGWKVSHLSAQLEGILENEIAFNQKLKELSKLYGENRNLLPPKVKELGSQPFNAKVRHNSISILDKLNDLFAANIQRSNLLHDQIKDTNVILNKLSNDHKDKLTRMTKKHVNKRNSSVKS